MVSSAISCDAEMFFSALRRSNTWLRNSMMPRRLNTIMIWNIHKDKLDIDEILEVSHYKIFRQLAGNIVTLKPFSYWL